MKRSIVLRVGAVALVAGLSVVPAFAASHEAEAEKVAPPEDSRGEKVAPPERDGDAAETEPAEPAEPKTSAPARREGS